MSIPTDPSYCLIYPMSYVRDVELDHFDTHNNLAGTCLHHCICHVTLQYMNDDPNQRREYSGSHLILPRGVQYMERLFPQDPPAAEPPGATDRFCHQGAFSHGTSGRLQVNGPDLQRVLWRLVPVHRCGPGPTQAAWDKFPPYQSEIPAPLALSYLQARQPKAMRRSPPRATTPNPAVESPKAKCSGSKGGHLCSSGHSSNTSTPKCPDSTSAKKPSSSKEPTSNDQEKSPRGHHSCKCGHSPLLSAESVGRKWKGVHTEGTHALNSTLPISSSAFDSFCSPMRSHSNVTELQPPSITLTPLGLGTPRQWRTVSDESRHSLVSIYTSLGINLLGYPATGPGNLTPSIPSLTGSHHVFSTWPIGMFTSRPSSPHLTIDQANSLFKLAAKCQALGIKLAKQFQVLSGLEAMHCNSIQGMVHETLMLGCSAWEAAYSAILWDRVSEDECETMTHHLRSEADAA